MKAKDKFVIMKDRVKENFLPEGKKLGLVFIGLIGTVATNKAIDKLLETHPDIEKWLKYVRPAAELGTGLLMAAIGTPSKKEKKEEVSILKYLGYGLAIAGGIDGIKLIPQAADLFAGLGEIQMPAVYYTEPENQLEDLGMASLPVGSLTMQNAEKVEVDLPDLEGYSKSTYTAPEKKTDLGYNGESTREADDLSGIV